MRSEPVVTGAVTLVHVVCSKTFRMQNCHRCSVGLYTAEDPTVVDCSDIWLLPFNGWYPKLDVVRDGHGEHLCIFFDRRLAHGPCFLPPCSSALPPSASRRTHVNHRTLPCLD